MAQYSQMSRHGTTELEELSDRAVPMPAYSWYVVGLLALVYAVHTMDRGVLTILLQPIGDEFKLSDTQLGLLAGLSYAIAFSIAAIPLGMLADRVNRARLLAILIAVWSALTTLSGFATGFRFLLAARVGVGIAEAGGQPTCLSIISDYVPPRRRSMAAGIFMSGIGLGSLLGLSATATVAATYGWRSAFLVAGPVGLLVALLVLLTLREPRDQPGYSGAVQKKAGAGLVATIRFILSQKSLALTLMATMCAVLANAGIATWMAPLLMRSHELELAHAGATTALVSGAMTLLGSLFGAYMVDRLGRSSLAGQLKFAAGIIFVAGIAVAIAATTGNFALALASLMVWGFAFPASHGVSFGFPVTLVPSAMRGATVGTLAVLNNLVGYGFGPQITGILSDFFKPTMGEDSLSMAILIVGAIAYGLACVLFLAASPSAEADLKRVQRWSSPQGNPAE